MRPIGFTTGFAFETIPSISLMTIDFCRQIGCSAIELNCIGGFEDGTLQALTALKPFDLKGFDHVSIHAPSRNMSYAPDAKHLRILNLIEQMSHILPIDLIVFHPDNVVDWRVFDRFSGLPIAFENMDDKKKKYRFLADMIRLFTRHDHGFVLDLNHCLANDPGLQLAYDLQNKLRSRIAEIHFSGLKLNKRFNRAYHYPVYKTEQMELFDAVPYGQHPLIIESACDSLAEAAKEFEFVKKHLK